MFDALHEESGARVVVRYVDPTRARDMQFVDRFREEAARLQVLRHEHLARLLEAGHVGTLPYLVSQYAEGPSAAELAARGPVPEKRVLGIARDAAAALAYADAAGRLHRDLKASDIFLGGAVKVTDVGVRHLAGDEAAIHQKRDQSAPPSVYMPPEQLFRGRADRTADIYALGAVLYELLTGRVPFAADTTAETLVNKQGAYLADPRRVAPTLSEGCMRLLDRMLALAPEDRYGTYEELCSDIEAVAAGGLPAAPELSEDLSSFDFGGVAETTAADAAASREVAPAPSGVPGWVWVVAAAAAAAAAWFLLR